MGDHEQTGLAGCFSIDEYERDVIKKHERTRRDKEDDRTRHMIALRAQTGVVFLTYRADAAIDRLQQIVTAGPPLYDFTATDGVHHTIWKAGAEETNSLVDAWRAIPALYIADGHHRAASAARARTELRPARRTAKRRPSSPWRSPTTRCRSCPTTGRSRTWPARRPSAVPGRAAAARRRSRTAGRPRSATGWSGCTSTARGIRWMWRDAGGRLARGAAGRRAAAERGARAGCCGSATSARTNASTSSAVLAAPRRSSRR